MMIVPCQPGPSDGHGKRVEFGRGWPVESDAARRMCATYCPLLESCLSESLRHREMAPGIIGGLDPDERRRERNRRSARQSYANRRDVIRRRQKAYYDANAEQGWQAEGLPC